MSSDQNLSQRDLNQAADPLSAFWNGVVSGAAPHPADLDPNLAGTVLRLHAVRVAPDLPAHVQDRIWAELIASWPIHSETVTLPPSHDRSSNGRVALGSAREPGFFQARPRWPVLHFATMALILFTVLASFVTIAGLHRRSATLGPVSLPGLDLPSAAIGETVLMRGTVDAIPASVGWASIDRVTLPPGAEWAFDENDGEGALLYRVESGQLTIRPDGPIAVTRAGTEHVHPSAPGTDVVLEAGDQGFTPPGIVSRWRNDGTSPAIILDARIMTARESHPPGVTRYTLVYDSLFSPPSTPFAFTVRRLTLPPTAVLRVADMPGLKLLFVESGQLQARDPQHPAGFRVVNGVDAVRTFPPDRLFQSAGAEPVTMLVLTVSPSNPLTETPLR